MDSSKDLLPQIYDSDAIVVQRFNVDGDFIDKLPLCKIVTRYGVGVDNINLEDMALRGVKVLNFPGFCTNEVADHTVSMILFLYRKLDILFKLSSEITEKWGNNEYVYPIKSVSDFTIGIVGFGRIGQAVLKRLKSFSFNVLVYDPYISADILLEYSVFTTDLYNLFERSDIVTLHTPLTNETKGMINETLFCRMNSNSCIINTSRGSVVNSEHLLSALKNKKIRACCIDVFDPEPPLKEIFGVNNLYISNHCAFYSEKSLDLLKKSVILESKKLYESTRIG